MDSNHNINISRQICPLYGKDIRNHIKKTLGCDNFQFSLEDRLLF